MLRTPVRFRGVPTRRPVASPLGNPFDIMSMIEELRRVHADFSKGREMVEKALEMFDAIKKGDPGRPGRPGRDGQNARQITESDVEAAVRKVFKQPKDGISPSAEEVAEAVLQSKKLFRFIKKRLKPGDPGKDGEAPEAQTLVGMVLAEMAKSKIAFGQVEGLEGKFAELRNHIATKNNWRGGGDTVTAGSGIAITDTVNGNKQISATGSGFDQLASTETPDGNITVFTFPTATAQPSLIVSDNVVMKATTRAGTVNWTWNSGLKQATMTIPPVDDIYAIV